MPKYYLAIDIGASGGRHILAHIENGKMKIEEIYRFENGMEPVDDELCWDHQRLFTEIIKGMKKCKELKKIPVSVSVDTWGVDFVLLDDEDRIIGNTVGYRDNRTKDMDKEVYKIISEKELYKRTGIQKATYNTIYQLMAIKKNHPEQLAKAKTLLFTPDYFHYMLSGRKVNEYTIATTSQLINPANNKWDYELIEMLGYPKDIFQRIVLPGTVIGKLTNEIALEVGFTCNVVAPASHDTASAVLSVPATTNKTIYISSGTWSLMGVERMTADCSEEAMKHNMTNEGGYDYRFRFLKNIMGLWMIQSVKKESGLGMSYDELCKKAALQNIDSKIDCYDERFLAPDNMTEEIAAYCMETNQQVPSDIYETASVIYNSLAKCYADTIKEIEMLTKDSYPCINVVGGGSNAVYLNELTAKYTGRTVYAGPSEATSIGNIAVQMLTDHLFDSVNSVRTCIFHSFGVEKYE